MSEQASIRPVASRAELYAIAYRIETRAAECYTVLAERMQANSNGELARMFLDLARAEGLHAEEIRRMAGDVGVVSGRGGRVSAGVW